jgi:hypothetical protein
MAASQANGQTIYIHLKTADQLFNTLDPSPFHERDLDDETERYIVGWAREIKGSGPLQLLVTLPDLTHNAHAVERIPDAIHNYFSYRATQSQQDIRELLRIGWRSLAIGLTVLMLCFVAIQFLERSAVQPTITRLAEQSLLIFGWVANWRPLEIFLYDWWPIRRHLALLRRLAAMPVEVRAADLTRLT